MRRHPVISRERAVIFTPNKVSFAYRYPVRLFRFTNVFLFSSAALKQAADWNGPGRKRREAEATDDQ